jgi:hypothetical protein
VSTESTDVAGRERVLTEASRRVPLSFDFRDKPPWSMPLTLLRAKSGCPFTGSNNPPAQPYQSRGIDVTAGGIRSLGSSDAADVAPLEPRGRAKTDFGEVPIRPVANRLSQRAMDLLRTGGRVSRGCPESQQVPVCDLIDSGGHVRPGPQVLRPHLLSSIRPRTEWRCRTSHTCRRARCAPGPQGGGSAPAGRGFPANGH